MEQLKLMYGLHFEKITTYFTQVNTLRKVNISKNNVYYFESYNTQYITKKTFSTDVDLIKQYLFVIINN